MGKGGDASWRVQSEDEISSILLKERDVKVSVAPDFYWDDAGSEEPHAVRRREILKKYPQIKKLYGPDHSTKFKALFWVVFQVFSVHLLKGAHWITWLFCCYTLSGSINHMLTLAMHEASHGLCAKGVTKNRFIGIMANLPMCIPASASFKRYHMEHHRFQGEDVLDVDIPSKAEGFFFTSTLRKILWCFLQPLFYSLRPMFVNPKTPSKWEFINISAIVVFDLLIVYLFNFSGLAYLAFGTLLGMGIHPVAGHFISEHYVMNDGQETYSYYGPLNWLTFQVGYHNEHHDFPFVTGKNLAQVRKIANEYYDDIPHYHSWIKVIYDFIFDDKISPYSRVKRVTLENQEIEDLQSRGGLVS
mmetsp:Transcript_22634/g.31941  ORF Transcript_22634/g.31941 Transcript_22634/m.31941 type:complete len:359 (-) Transcript_22634:348-1424(-)